MLQTVEGAGRLSMAASLNFEMWTLRKGDLAAGNAGEGYIDRRHPHTWLHEMVATARLPLRGADFSLAAGRGFARSARMTRWSGRSPSSPPTTT